jgi:hypothetical protein
LVIGIGQIVFGELFELAQFPVIDVVALSLGEPIEEYAPL